MDSCSQEVHSGPEETAETLFEKCDRNLDKALYLASSDGHTEAIEQLLSKGADVNARDIRRGSALQAASYKGHEQIVNLLLEKGADVNAQGGHCGNALQAASIGVHEQIVKLLLEKDVDVNAQGGYYGNALQAISFRGHEQIVNLLLEKGADVNAQGGLYGNALQAASVEGHEQIVRLLLEKDVDVNAQGGYYGNALQAASYGDHEPIVKLLLEKGVYVNARGGHYCNALQAASGRGFMRIVNLLISSGANVNVQGGFYGSTLHAAVETGHEDIVKLLLSYGADYTLTDSSGLTARDIASMKEFESIVRLFGDPQPSPVHLKKQPTEPTDQPKQRPPNPPSELQAQTCKAYNAYLQYHFDGGFKDKQMSVFDLIYGDYKEELVADNGKVFDGIPTVRWIHLPANNRRWIKDVIDRLCFMERRSTNYRGDIRAFAEDNLNKPTTSINNTFFRLPGFKWEWFQDKYRISLAIPYFDFESENSYRNSKKEEKEKTEEKSKRLRHVYKEDLHLPKTLDESYYLGLASSNGEEDKSFDQVVYRYTSRRRDEWINNEKIDERPREVQQRSEPRTIPVGGISDGPQFKWKPNEQNGAGLNRQVNKRDQAQWEPSQEPITPKLIGTAPGVNKERRRPNREVDKGPTLSILMVHSLWLWKIDDRTIITAFSDREHEGDQSANRTLLKSIIRSSKENLIRSPEQLVALIVLRCIDYVDFPCKAGLQEDVLSIFEASIAEMSEKVVKFYDKFSASLKEHITKRKYDIKDEIACLLEVKDIRNEITMIYNMFYKQREVIENLTSTAKDEWGKKNKSQKGPENPHSMVYSWDEFINDKTICRLEDRIKPLVGDTERIEDSLNHLLDLEQKQANLYEAVSASKQAVSTSKQGKTILVFTVVTVVFTPLSFMAGLFALPISDQFPQGTAGANSFSTNYIGKWMTTGEIVTLLTIVLGILIALGWDSSQKQAVKEAEEAVATNTQKPSIIGVVLRRVRQKSRDIEKGIRQDHAEKPGPLPE
ncbi:hypothetical protein BP5796_12390 [Coleophoma crateriformis]|uniref:Uncharacterized protein n=1 Tax=Coleophoma crateriformis TaxID=565419 RepID=A0A3D8Q9W2_9HELO|nr:hypothetical protein BP5796_12390 [Coleophoma crateriformis]